VCGEVVDLGVDGGVVPAAIGVAKEGGYVDGYAWVADAEYRLDSVEVVRMG
jgi:hypothetical protein